MTLALIGIITMNVMIIHHLSWPVIVKYQHSGLQKKRHLSSLCWFHSDRDFRRTIYSWVYSLHYNQIILLDLIYGPSVGIVDSDTDSVDYLQIFMEREIIDSNNVPHESHLYSLIMKVLQCTTNYKERLIQCS